jgi:hypothetical protein
MEYPILAEVILFERPVKAVDRGLTYKEFSDLHDAGFRYDKTGTDEPGNSYLLMVKS